MSEPDLLPAASIKRIIIVEDDGDLLENMVKYLTLSGFEVAGAASAREFYFQLSIQPCSLAIIDIGLPDQSGLVLAEYVRNNTDMRIIILTARAALEDKIAGLKSGADFYMVKPVDCAELSLMITNIFIRIDESLSMRRREPQRARGGQEPGASSWRLDPKEWILRTPKGEAIMLTSKEYGFIALFNTEKRATVFRREILRLLGYPETEQASHALESMVYRLRKKIEDMDCEFPFKTSHGVGYCLSADIIYL